MQRERAADPMTESLVRPMKTPDAAFLDAASAAVDLDIAPEYREGVQRFLAIAAEFAEALEGAPDDDHQAHAPVYTPPAR